MTVSGFTMIRAFAQSDHSCGAQSKAGDRGGAIWDGAASLEHYELLAQSNGLQSKIVARHEKGPAVSDHRESDCDHQFDLT